MRTPTRKTIAAKTNNRCAYCGKPLTRGWQRDHVEPLIRHRGVRFSFAGSNGCKHPERHTAANIVAACRPCNKAKGAMDLETYRAVVPGRVFYFERTGKP